MRTSPRLYVQTPLASGESVTLGGDQKHYLIRVMRLAGGDTVRLFNGADGEAAATIREITKSSVTLEVGSRLREFQLPHDLWLLFAPLKKQQTDLVIEKAAELGARRIVPVRTERTQAQFVRADRLRRIAIEASEQTERLDVPAVDDEQPLLRVLRTWNTDRELFFCDEAAAAVPGSATHEEGEAALAAQAFVRVAGRPAAILVGPEGGFTDAERLTLRAHPSVTPISLGPRILRGETAAIVVLGLWGAVAGDGREIAGAQ